MAGTYNGTDFGGASTWFESVTGRTDAQRQQAAANITAARERGVVVSADGERLWLALPSAVAFSPVAALSPAVPTRGPGAPSVGAAPTGGVGVPQVGSAPTKGPGARVVRIGGSVAGSGAGAGVVVSPMVPKNSQLERVGDGRPQESWGAISDIGWQNTEHGWTTVPSNDAKQRMEDDIFQETAWQVRNKVLPDLMLVPQPFPDAWGSPDNYNWNWLTNTWTPKAGTVVPGGGF